MSKKAIIELDDHGRIVRIDVQNPPEACARGDSDKLLEDMQALLADWGIDMEFEVRAKSPQEIRSEGGAAAPLPTCARQHSTAERHDYRREGR